MSGRKFGLVLSCFLLMFFLSSNSFGQRTIEFSGITWYVRNDFGGPGPNSWSGSKNSVWVDSEGRLHMKIQKIDNQWYCTEIYAQQSFGYGEYRFHLHK